MINITTLNQLEKRRLDELKSLDPSEVQLYIENLTKCFYKAFDISNIDSMDNYHKKITEVIDLFDNKYENIIEGVNFTDKQVSTNYMVYYKTKLHLLSITSSILELMNEYCNLFENYVSLKDMIQTLYIDYLDFSVNIHQTKHYMKENDKKITDEILENRFNNNNLLMSCFNTMIDELKGRIESNLSKIKELINEFDDISSVVDSNLENNKIAYNDISSNYPILEDLGILDDINNVNTLLDLISRLLNEGIIDSLVDEVSDYISSSNVFKDPSEKDIDLIDYLVSYDLKNVEFKIERNPRFKY